MPPRAAAVLEKAARKGPGRPSAAQKLAERAGATGELSRISFRAFLESPHYCGLELSPAIAAIADASEGIRPSIEDDLAVEIFGCVPSALPEVARQTVAVRAGRRGGKTSRLLAPKALHAAWTVPLPLVRTGEEAAAMIVAPDLDAARQTLSFAEGYAESSPVLRAALVRSPTKNAIALRRPDGHVVQVRVRAASRGGKGGRGWTLVFAGLEEAAFFYDEDTGVVNDREIRRAMMPALVPGAQAWVVSTPWLVDVGLLEELVSRNYGTHAHALVALATTRRLNPAWDSEGELERTMREEDPENAAREIDAVPMAGGSNAFFDPLAVDAAMTGGDLPRARGGVAAMGVDAAFVRDASAGVVAQREGGKIVVADITEMRPERGKPLKPSAVAAGWAAQAARYGLRSVMGDGHGREAMREHLAASSVAMLSAPEGAGGKEQVYRRVRALVHEGRVVLPRMPRLARQLKDVMARQTSGGGCTIMSPRRSGGHGDIVSALVLAVWQVDRMAADAPALVESEDDRMEAALEARHGSGRAEWWERDPTMGGYV